MKDKFMREFDFQAFIKKERIKRMGTMVLHKLRTKKYMKAATKWSKKNIQYFSVYDDSGSYIIWDDRNKKPSVYILQENGKNVSKTPFVAWLQYLKTRTFEEAAYEIFKYFMIQEHREELTFLFKFKTDSTAREILKKALDKDQEKHEKELEKIIERNERAEELL